MFSNLRLGSLHIHIIVHFVCIHIIRQSRSQDIFFTNPEKTPSSQQKILSKKAVRSKTLINDTLDVNKDRSNRPYSSTSKISERKCTEIKVHNYKQYL